MIRYYSGRSNLITNQNPAPAGFFNGKFFLLILLSENLSAMNATSESVDQYIASFPKETQKLLKDIRKIIKKAAPKAEEVISYGMPGYKLNGSLVWFAGNKNHIGFYPTNGPIKIFKQDLVKYKTSKGAIQFPLDKPIPASLVTKIVKLRIRENNEKEALKKKKKK
jgi:uncharacterized protein YdhG (YjbR/CyaY superfamily)